MISIQMYHMSMAYTFGNPNLFFLLIVLLDALVPPFEIHSSNQILKCCSVGQSFEPY